MKKRLFTAVYIILGGLFFLPVAGTFLKSLIFNSKPSLLEYWELFTLNHAFFHYFDNSLIYSLSITAVSLLISLPLGFVFAKISFRGSKALFFAYILIMLLPFQATLLPNYIQLRSFNMLNTPLALTLPMMFSPISVFLLRQFLKNIQDELISCAQLETSSALKMLRHVILPQALPAIAALGVLIFCESWNIVEQALIFSMDNGGIHPLSVKLSELPENVASAGGIVYLFPILALFTLFREALEKIPERNEI